MVSLDTTPKWWSALSEQTHLSELEKYSGVRLSFYTYYISPIEIGLLWAKITYLKTHSNALGFELQTDTK